MISFLRRSFLCGTFWLLGALPGLATGNQIGVIMGSEGCPGGAAPLTIHIDNEDNNNQNNRGGWIGATVSDRNTTFHFCRVSGNNFFSVGQPYMVLSLGSTCPNGSQTVSRRFDGENQRPACSTNINGPAEGLPGEIVSGDRSDVRMYFCLFHGSGGTGGSLPVIGVEYGVFAPWSFGSGLATGFVYLDDEDTLFGGGTGINQNQWCEDTSYQQLTPRATWDCDPWPTEDFWDPWTSPYRQYVAGNNIMDGGLNTGMDIVKARGSVCGNGFCRSPENCANCSSDCGACAVCGDGVCSGAEVCSSCIADCGICPVCGDGLCTGGESCGSCCQDCGVCNPGEACTTSSDS